MLVINLVVNLIKMPYIGGKLKGQLTQTDIRKLIVSHNKLSKISIPPKTNRDGLIKLIHNKGYRVDHGNNKLVKRTGLLKKAPPSKKKVTVKTNGVTTKEFVRTKEQKKEMRKALPDKKKAEHSKNLEEQLKEEWNESDNEYVRRNKAFKPKKLVKSDIPKLEKLIKEIKEDFIDIDDGIVKEEMRTWSPIDNILTNIKKKIRFIKSNL